MRVLCFLVQLDSALSLGRNRVCAVHSYYCAQCLAWDKHAVILDEWKNDSESSKKLLHWGLLRGIMSYISRFYCSNHPRISVAANQHILLVFPEDLSPLQLSPGWGWPAGVVHTPSYPKPELMGGADLGQQFLWPRAMSRRAPDTAAL